MPHSLITGGAGFIGSHLAEALLARGDRVSVVDDESTGSVANLAAVVDHPRFRYTKGTVADRELVRALVAEADEVYHLAAAVGVQLIAQSPIRTIETNVFPTELLLEELGRVHDAGRPVKFFLASTSEVYGKNPKPQYAEDDDLVFGPTRCARWSYGASKAIDEFLALAYWRERRLPVVVGRLFNVVGPRQTGAYGMVLPRFVEAAVAGRPLVVHDDGRQVRCFAHVSDVVRAIVALMQTPAAVGGVFNIGSDRPVSILELAEMAIAAARRSPSRAGDCPDFRVPTGHRREALVGGGTKMGLSPSEDADHGTVSPIEFQSYAEAYDRDFEDCRRRVPDLGRLRQTIEFAPQYDLERIVRELVEMRMKDEG